MKLSTIFLVVTLLSGCGQAERRDAGGVALQWTDDSEASSENAADGNPPVLTDEFDAFIVTPDMPLGHIIGQIQPVFENPLPIAYSLISPIPGADRRGYIKPHHRDATKIVDIDENTGELRLIAHPDNHDEAFYAQVRGANAAGYMDQVLIIVAMSEWPKRENALDIFTQSTDAYGIKLLATKNVAPEKLAHAAKVMRALLHNDWNGDKAVVQRLNTAGAMMSIFGDFEERNTALGYYMFDFNSQDLQDEEIIPDFARLGGPTDMRRDASVEEIAHIIHFIGLADIYPDWQKRLNAASFDAIERGYYKPWTGLPEEDFDDEYLAIGLEIVYGMKQNTMTMGRTVDENGDPIQPAFRLSLENDIALTAENLKIYDPKLYELVLEVFPGNATFRREMGWK